MDHRAELSLLEEKVRLLTRIGEESQRRGTCRLNISIELPSARQYQALYSLEKEGLIRISSQRCPSTNSLYGECHLTDEGKGAYQRGLASPPLHHAE